MIVESKVFYAKSSEEAVEQLLKSTNADKESIQITVIEKPSKGFLGIGAKSGVYSLEYEVLKESEPSKKELVEDAKEVIMDKNDDQNTEPSAQDKVENDVKENTGDKDQCGIYALLYEAKGKDGKEVTLTGTDINTSEYIVLKAEVTDKTAKEDWTYFEIPFEKMNDKEYDAANQYKLALICTSSKEGDRYRGAPGSILMIDDLKITR